MSRNEDPKVDPDLIEGPHANPAPQSTQENQEDPSTAPIPNGLHLFFAADPTTNQIG